MNEPIKTPAEPPTNDHIMHINSAIVRQQGDYASEMDVRGTDKSETDDGVDPRDFNEYISEHWEELPAEI
jgi:hypothetical protein